MKYRGDKWASEPRPNNWATTNDWDSILLIIKKIII